MQDLNFRQEVTSISTCFFYQSCYYKEYTLVRRSFGLGFASTLSPHPEGVKLSFYLID